MRNQEAARRSVAGEGIKGERPVTSIDRVDHFLQLAIGQDRQDGPEDLAPHQIHLARHVEDNVRRNRRFDLSGVWPSARLTSFAPFRRASSSAAASRSYDRWSMIEVKSGPLMSGYRLANTRRQWLMNSSSDPCGRNA